MTGSRAGGGSRHEPCGGGPRAPVRFVVIHHIRSLQTKQKKTLLGCARRGSPPGAPGASRCRCGLGLVVDRAREGRASATRQLERFENADVAQQVEQQAEDLSVGGSNPLIHTKVSAVTGSPNRSSPRSRHRDDVLASINSFTSDVSLVDGSIGATTRHRGRGERRRRDGDREAGAAGTSSMGELLRIGRRES